MVATSFHLLNGPLLSYAQNFVVSPEKLCIWPSLPIAILLLLLISSASTVLAYHASMDELDSLKTALHALDKRLTETDAWARSGIDNTAGNLQRIVDGLKETRDHLYHASNGKPGLISVINTWYYETLPSLRQRMDALEKRQAWQMRILITGLVTLVTGMVLLVMKK